MYLVEKSPQLSIGETVVDPDCRFTLPELAVVVVSKAELISSTVLTASVAAFLFFVAAAAFSLASRIFSLDAAIISSGLKVAPGDEVVVGGSVAVELPGSEVDETASHSSSMVAAPDVTYLKQYSFSGMPSLEYQC